MTPLPLRAASVKEVVLMLRTERRRYRSAGSLLTVTAVVIGLVVGAGILGDRLLRVHQPFKTEIVDRTPAITLQQLRDLAEYKAASANFEVLVDIEQDVKWMPAVVAGERTFFVGIGSVDAVVDFDRIDVRDVTIADDRSVVIVLPPARYTSAVVDPEKSHVAARDRGILNRVSGVFADNPTSEQPLYVLAAEKMQAAAQETELKARAEANTSTMLRTLLGSLGYHDVEVRFDPARAAVDPAA